MSAHEAERSDFFWGGTARRAMVLKTIRFSKNTSKQMC